MLLWRTGFPSLLPDYTVINHISTLGDAFPRLVFNIHQHQPRVIMSDGHFLDQRLNLSNRNPKSYNSTGFGEFAALLYNQEPSGLEFKLTEGHIHTYIYIYT